METQTGLGISPDYSWSGTDAMSGALSLLLEVIDYITSYKCYTTYMKQKILNLIDTISTVWEKLPKEIRVSIYLALSYSIADLVTRIESLDLGGYGIVLIFAINIVLVFLKELRKRIELARQLIAKLK